MTQTEIEREREKRWQLDRVINAASETSYPAIPCVVDKSQCLHTTKRYSLRMKHTSDVRDNRKRRKIIMI